MSYGQSLPFAGAGAAPAGRVGCAFGGDFGTDGAGGGRTRDELDPAGFGVLGDHREFGCHRSMAAAADETDVFPERIHRMRQATVYPLAQCENGASRHDLGRAVWFGSGGGRGTGAADDGGLY